MREQERAKEREREDESEREQERARESETGHHQQREVDGCREKSIKFGESVYKTY